MWGWLPQYGHSVFIVSTIVAAVLGGIGIGAAFVSAIVGYQLTEMSLGEANERIAVADARGEEAKAQVEKAQADIARANAEIAGARQQTAALERETASAKERTAALEKEAAQARTEQERLKAQLAWRTLPPVMTAELERHLSQKPLSVNIQHIANDTEALYLAIQLGNIFGKAKWQVAMLATTHAGAVIFGIWVPDSPSPGTAVIRDALRAVGISFSTDTPPPAGMGFGGSLEGAATLLVGSKPIPP
jgi:hypothetical protein